MLLEILRWDILVIQRNFWRLSRITPYWKGREIKLLLSVMVNKQNKGMREMRPEQTIGDDSKEAVIQN